MLGDRRGSARALIVLVASAASVGLGLLAQLLIARTFSTEAFGIYATLISAFSLLAPLASLGADRLLLRHYFRGEPAVAALILGPGATLITASGATAALGLAMVAPPLLDVPRGLYSIGAIALLALTLRPLAQASLQAEYRDGAVAGWTLLTPMGQLLAAGIAAAAAAPFATFLMLFAAFEIALAAAALAIAWRLRGRLLTERAPLRDGPALLREGLPFAASGLLHAVYYKSDVLMLGALLGTQASGLYQAAFLFIGAVYLLPGALLHRFLMPRIFHWRETGTTRLPIAGLAGGGLLFGLTSAGVLAGIADPLMRTFFGPDYAAAIPILQGLTLAIPLRCAAMALGAFLLDEREIRRKVTVQAALAAGNVGLNLALIPLLGIAGAVVATLVTEATLLSLYAYLIRGRGRAGPDRRDYTRREGCETA